MFALTPARALSVSDRERFILSGSADCYVKIWALGIGMHQNTNTPGHSDIILYTHVCVPDGRKAPQGFFLRNVCAS